MLLYPLATSAARAPGWLWPEFLFPVGGYTTQCRGQDNPLERDSRTQGTKGLKGRRVGSSDLRQQHWAGTQDPKMRLGLSLRLGAGGRWLPELQPRPNIQPGLASFPESLPQETDLQP